MRREERVRRITPPSLTSLFSTLFIVVVFVLAGCNTDGLTGPILGPETTIQADGGGGDDHNCGDGSECKSGGDEYNLNGLTGGDDYNTGSDLTGKGDEQNTNGLECGEDIGGGDEHNC